MLTSEQVWQHPNEQSNSIGNLLLHLAGNVRHFIISNIGGAPDRRNRRQEFDERTPLAVETLLANLKQTVQEAAAVLAQLDEQALLAKHEIFGAERTVFYAVQFVVHHFVLHAGQIFFLTKLLTGQDAGLSGAAWRASLPQFINPNKQDTRS